MATQLPRQNAERDRHDALARALRAAWYEGNKSWVDLAGIALGILKPGSARADAVFTIELHEDGSSSVRTRAEWGGDPEAILARGIAALQAEAGDLKICPYHQRAKSTIR